MAVKGEAKREKDDKDQEQKKGSGLGLLAGYSDSGDESEDDNPASDNREDDRGEGVAGRHQDPDDDAAKMARRARAKEWAEKRRASKDPCKDTTDTQG
jgi:hypothetical protein